MKNKLKKKREKEIRKKKFPPQNVSLLSLVDNLGRPDPDPY